MTAGQVHPGRIEFARRPATAVGDGELRAYLHRVGHSQPNAADADVLQSLHLAHASHIPFENLDIFLKQ
ncbi:MAG TPA: hypothetical protein VIU02_01265, partial [Burkholderiales bacterium]